MNQKNTTFSSLVKSLFSTRAAGVYMLVFAVAIAVATFIENDFGTSSAQKLVYKAPWFTTLLTLFALTIINNIYVFKMVKNKRWPVLLLHVGIIVILIGAAVTRYVGYEGMMHIRVNQSANTFLSAETYMGIRGVENAKYYAVDKPVLFSALGNNNWKGKFQFGNTYAKVEVLDLIPNPIENIVEDENGKAILKLVSTDGRGRQEYFLAQGEVINVNGLLFNFSEDSIPNAIRIAYDYPDLTLVGLQPMTVMTMATRQLDTLIPTSEGHALRFRSLYSDGMHQFVFSEFVQKGSVVMESSSPKITAESTVGLQVKTTVDGQSQTQFVHGQKGVVGKPVIFDFPTARIEVQYGAKKRELPFQIKLDKFILERYPGTNSAASYRSEVHLIDPRKNLNEAHSIFMNNILDYDGYRFFQSSFDRDEQGTILSVNHDFWGTWISYLGYALLTIGMVWIFFAQRTRWNGLKHKLAQIESRASIIGFVLLCSSSVVIGQAQPVHEPVVSADHAARFSRVVVQDFNGRMKPMHTLSRELMRKIYRKESFAGNNADQVVLSMFAMRGDWAFVPLIKLSPDEKIQNLLNVHAGYASYRDFFDSSGVYKLKEAVSDAYEKLAKERGMHEKDLIKIDERVNVMNMIFTGHIFRIIPLEDDPNNTWVSNIQDMHTPAPELAKGFFNAYEKALQEGVVNGDYLLADELVHQLKAYQDRTGSDIIPSETRINMEILLNNLNVFGRLAGIYGLLAIYFLILLFVSVFNDKINLKPWIQVGLVFMALAFLFHTFGLGLRWYVSGRAPWSNGYESMIYIAWTSCLSGLLFARRSVGALAATMMLAASMLLVATLSYLNPEITPLVPVLRSYWLTIHVSLEAGSYGFLMLGAIIGFLNLVLMIMMNEKNRRRVDMKIREMSYISEMTITAGLVLVSIGTYLGGVWANESWGRYWGWDAKETWALVTILVYAFILHMRLIPKAFNLFSYNISTLFGFATVIMTYYGVNYYLSGLHSYAAGDPVPIPNWVYIGTVVCVIIGVAAYIKYRKFYQGSESK